MFCKVIRFLSGLIFSLCAGYTGYALHTVFNCPGPCAAQAAELRINSLITAVFVLLTWMLKRLVHRFSLRLFP